MVEGGAAAPAGVINHVARDDDGGSITINHTTRPSQTADR